MGGHAIRVFDNRVSDNDTPNFAPRGNIVATVPTGTGVMVMANADVHVFGNTLENNGTANVMLIGYKKEFTDKSYNPLIRGVVVRDNRHGRAGFAPAFPGGKELAAAMGGALPPVFWDGTGSDIVVRDPVPALSLNLPGPAAPVEQAKPAPASFPSATLAPEPKPVTLPASMEAAIR